MKTTSRVSCECTDPGCKACKGRCTESANVTLVRIDFTDQPECDFCDKCADDAMDSGLFSLRNEDTDAT